MIHDTDDITVTLTALPVPFLPSHGGRVRRTPHQVRRRRSPRCEPREHHRVVPGDREGRPVGHRSRSHVGPSPRRRIAGTGRADPQHHEHRPARRRDSRRRRRRPLPRPVRRRHRPHRRASGGGGLSHRAGGDHQRAHTPAPLASTCRLCAPTAISRSVWWTTGYGAAAPASKGGGRGIAGMTERAHVLGGRLTAGPPEGGGFSVMAQIPRSARPPRRFAGRSREAAT